MCVIGENLSAIFSACYVPTLLPHTVGKIKYGRHLCHNKYVASSVWLVRPYDV